MSALTFCTNSSLLHRSCWLVDAAVEVWDLQDEAVQTLNDARSSLSVDITNSVPCTIVGARLDYCNSILNDISHSSISKLQRVQNTLARVVTDIRNREQITPVLQNLHWLPVSD